MSRKFTAKVGLFLLVVFVLALIKVAVYYRNSVQSSYPPDITNALSRIEKIPRGLLQKDIFSFLGLSRPSEGPSKEWVEGRTGRTWTRYRNNVSSEFVLECESQIKSGSDDDVESGVLLSVLLRHVEKNSDGSVLYSDLAPRWTAFEK